MVNVVPRDGDVVCGVSGASSGSDVDAFSEGSVGETLFLVGAGAFAGVAERVVDNGDV